MGVPKIVGKQLLLVEAENKFRQQRVHQLEQHGYLVATIANGREAFNALRAAPPPDLILIDPFTPNLSGREFRQAQLLDRRLARVPVLVLAGPDMRADFPGDVGFIPTPTDHTELLRAVEQFAQQRRPEILVVEDQPDVLLMLEKALTYYGFVPRLASGGQVALEVYRRHRDSIDLAMIDVQMAPLDGPQTLAALRQIHPQVRAAFMSGHAGTFTTEDLLAMGAALVFIKPFELGSLAEDLWQLLQGPQVAGAAVAQPA